MRRLLTSVGRRMSRVVDAFLAQQNGYRLLLEDGSCIIVE